jgi:hypothetical protein
MLPVLRAALADYINPRRLLPGSAACLAAEFKCINLSLSKVIFAILSFGTAYCTAITAFFTR